MADWAAALRDFVHHTPPPPTENATDLAEKQLMKAPLTFTAGRNGGTPVQQSLLKCARALQADQQSAAIFSNDELENIWRLLAEHHSVISVADSPAAASVDKAQSPVPPVETISYEDFCKVAKLLPSKCQRFFTPSTFLCFARPMPDTPITDTTPPRIPTQPFFSYILRRASLLQERVCISLYDVDGDGWLLEPELEKYVADLAPTFPHLEAIEKDFMSFYLCGAVRKFFFFLDPLRRGKISIKDLLLSPILSEFFELQQPDLSAGLLLSNWFSPYSATKIYSQYVDLDEDRNGMLNKFELEKYAKTRYSREFIHRVFEECQTYGGELDYKNYLDFVLAINDLNSPQSMAYVFRILDVHGRKCLDEFSVRHFVMPLAQRSMLPLNISDFLDELFDMANPRERHRITLQDLVACGQGGSLLALLIDSQALTQNQFKD